MCRRPFWAAQWLDSLRLLLFILLVLPFGAAFAVDAVVLVASGSVSAIRADGQPALRELRASGSLTAGDQINTGKDGHVQMRFTDGAIVSLQPNTQFRIEEYQFEGGQQRGFFNLLRGALRTTSGLIGKRSTSDYEMRTPTATIGIRGTDYIAEFTVCDPVCSPGPQAGLRVAVNEGRVALTNPAGEVLISQGQAGGASSLTTAPGLIDNRPVLSPRTLLIDTLPTVAAKPGETVANADSAQPQNSSTSAARSRSVPDVQSSKAKASVLSSPAINTSPADANSGSLKPGETVSSSEANVRTDGYVAAGSQVTAGVHDVTGGQAEPQTGTVTAPVNVANNSGGELVVENSPNKDESAIATTTESAGNIASAPNERTDAATGANLTTSSANIPPNATAINGAVTGTAPGAAPNFANWSNAFLSAANANSTATSSALRTAAVRSPSATEDNSNVIGVPAGLASMVVATTQSTRDSAGNLTLPGSSGSACTTVNSCGHSSTNSSGAKTDTSNDTTGAGSSSSGSSSSGSSSSGSGSSGSGSSGSSSSGSSSSGSSSSGSGSSGSGSSGSGSSGSGSSGSGSSGSGSSAQLVPGAVNAASLSMALRGVPLFDAVNFGNANSLVTLDSERRLQSIGACPNGFCLSRGTAVFAETGSDPYVSWGRWKGGDLALRTLGVNSTVTLAYLQGLHYVVGVPTQVMPSSGSFTYELLGATKATASDGSVSPGVLTASAVVQFSPGTQTRVGLQGSVSFTNTTLAFSSNGGLNNPAASNLTMRTPNTFSGALSTTQTGTSLLNCANNGCTTQVRGGFYGPDAARMGIDYSISGSGNRTINGVGVLTKP